MNISINLDITPEEMRRLMGLPDVQEFNQKIMDQMIERMQDGSFDPTGFFRTSVMGMDAFKQWSNAFSPFMAAATMGKTDDKS